MVYFSTYNLKNITSNEKIFLSVYYERRSVCHDFKFKHSRVPTILMRIPSYTFV